MMDRFKETFREEAGELLEQLETSLLELEEKPQEQELLDTVFRALHTIKGSSAMFGFDSVSSFTHEVEEVYDKIRNGEIALTRELIDLTLEVKDQIRVLLDESEAVKPGVAADTERIVQAFLQLQPERPLSQALSREEGPTGESVAKEISKTFRIRFKPDKGIFLHGTDPAKLLAELGSMGEHVILAHMEDIPSLEEINPELCYVWWDIILTTKREIAALQDVFIFVEDKSELSIEIIDQGDMLDAEDDYKRLGEILVDRGDISNGKLQEIIKETKRIGEILEEDSLVQHDEVESALAEQRYMRTLKGQQQKSVQASSIRVGSDKLDTLIDLVGELVTVQARLSQSADQRAEPELTAVAEQVERLISDLRDNAMSLRMLQIGATFNKFRRLVRDLSSELGKEITLTTQGAETELDKTVIDRLGDPLVHLIRNCIDHGIEMPEVRKKAGKPQAGTVLLAAAHEGANVTIRISDDGAGMDRDAIRAKAVSKGLIVPEGALTDQEIYALIFQPGFSTAVEVTKVSGRGVGMDVVKRALDALGGQIEISSERGKGTTIVLKLPLTLAIIEGLLVSIGSQTYVLPLSTVEECVELKRNEIDGDGGRRIANVRGEILPYVRLRDVFGAEGEAPEIETIVVVSLQDRRIGFVVDWVIGDHQTVIKPLGSVYRDVEQISGATILGDGSVALILDVLKLALLAEQEDKSRINGGKPPGSGIDTH